MPDLKAFILICIWSHLNSDWLDKFQVVRSSAASAACVDLQGTLKYNIYRIKVLFHRILSGLVEVTSSECFYFYSWHKNKFLGFTWQIYYHDVAVGNDFLFRWCNKMSRQLRTSLMPIFFYRGQREKQKELCRLGKFINIGDLILGMISELLFWWHFKYQGVSAIKLDWES